MRRSSSLRPLHPPLTDFPVALWVMAFVFDLVSFGAGNAFVKAAFYNLAAGDVIALLAAAAGLFDFTRIAPGHRTKKVALVHAGLNVLALVIFSVEAWARSSLLAAPHTPVPLVVLSAVGVALVLSAAYVGGQLVYDLGVNVAALTPTERLAPEYRARPLPPPPRPEVPPRPPREVPPPIEPLHP